MQKLRYKLEVVSMTLGGIKTMESVVELIKTVTDAEKGCVEDVVVKNDTLFTNENNQAKLIHSYLSQLFYSTEYVGYALAFKCNMNAQAKLQADLTNSLQNYLPKGEYTFLSTQSEMMDKELIQSKDDFFSIGVYTEQDKTRETSWEVMHKEQVKDLMIRLEKGEWVGTYPPHMYDTSKMWLTINLVDGKGYGTEHVASYWYALITSDTMDAVSQRQLLLDLRIPIKAMIMDGENRFFAIISINADNLPTYRARVNYLYQYLGSHGYKVKTGYQEPHVMCPISQLVAGEESMRLEVREVAIQWDTWVQTVLLEKNKAGILDTRDDVRREIMSKRPYVVEGLLKRGEKMRLTGAAKVGKTFLLTELALAISRGKEWLGYPCMQGKVLYINTELHRDSFHERLDNMEVALGIEGDDGNRLDAWHVRGCAKPLSELLMTMKKYFKPGDYDVVIIDPIYKVLEGDENNAMQMGEACNNLDKLAEYLQCAIVYSHHHSKGPQEQKDVIERSSGSGVFGRDPDVIIDLLKIDLDKVSQAVREAKGYGEGTTACHVEGVVRDRGIFKTKYVAFQYPVHEEDTSGLLAAIYYGKTSKIDLEKYMVEDISVEAAHHNLVTDGEDAMVASNKNFLHTKNRAKKEEKEFKLKYMKNLLDYHQASNEATGMDLSVVAQLLGMEEQSIRRYVKEEVGVEIKNNKVYIKM